MKYHFIWHLLNDEQLKLEKICGSKNPADMLTKGITIEKLKLCTISIGLLAWKQRDWVVEIGDGRWKMKRQGATLMFEIVSKREIVGL